MRRKQLDFILFLLVIIYDRMTCEVNVGTHHLSQPLVPSIMRDRRSTLRNDIHHPLLSSNTLIASNHPNLVSHHQNTTSIISPNNSSILNKNEPIGVFTNNSTYISTQAQRARPRGLTSFRSAKRRSRRDVLLLYNVVSCGTGCNPMRLMGYGCYCGFMGAGIPVDGIDKCCQVHDRCYDTVPCPSFMLYFLRYNWQCVQGTPQCYPQSNNCAFRMCQCDRMFAECLRQQPCPKQKVFCQSAPWRLIQNLLFDVGIAG